MSQYLNPFPQHSDIDGNPNAFYKVYFGEPDQDPKTNPKVPFSDKSLQNALDATQTLNSTGAYAQDIFLDGAYSVRIETPLGSLWRETPSFEGVASSLLVDNFTVTSMIADAALSLGDFVSTVGYFAVDAAGGNTYEIVAGGTGTDDGGTFIDLDNGLQAEGLFPLGVLSVKQWGATGDGSTDDTAAIHAALIEAKLRIRAKLYFPAGVYVLNSVAVTGSVATRFLSIEGDGVGSTVILCTSSNTTGAFSITYTDRESITSISNMTITTEANGGGTAITVTQPVGGNRHNRSLYIQDVDINVSDVTQNFWNKGINATGCWRPYIRSVLVGGPFGPGVSSDLSDSSPLFDMLIGMDLDDTYHPDIVNCYIWSCSTGISCISAESPGPEAFRMDSTNIVSVKTAVSWLRIDREPTIWITNCHINYRNNGFDINGAKLVIIKGCIPYNEDVTDEYGATPIDMVFDNTERVIISDNIFHFNGNPNRVNVSFDSTTVFDEGVISNNIFNSQAATAIFIGSGATNVSIIHNKFPGNITEEIDDNSNEAVIVDNLSMTSGSWTPQLDFGGGSTGLIASKAVGKWSVSGEQFHFSIHIILTAVGSSTGVAGVSLPALTDLPGSGTITVDSGAVEWPSYLQMVGLTGAPSGRPNSSTSLRLFMSGTTILSNLDETNFSDTSNFNLSGTLRFS